VHAKKTTISRTQKSEMLLIAAVIVLVLLSLAWVAVWPQLDRKHSHVLILTAGAVGAVSASQCRAQQSCASPSPRFAEETSLALTEWTHRVCVVVLPPTLDVLRPADWVRIFLCSCIVQRETFR
jgi:hypothetical protein